MTRTAYTAMALMALVSLSTRAGAQTPDANQTPATEPQASASKEQAQRKEVRREVGEAVDSIRAYSFERRQEAIAIARHSMDELDAQLDRLQAQSQAQWTRMSDATRSRSQQTAVELRQQRNTVSEWYGGMRQSSATAWSDVKRGFIVSYHELVAAMQKAREDVREDPPPQQDREQDQRK